MTSSETIQKSKGPRPLFITNDPLAFGNIEAWINIIDSYKAAHPGHTVTLLYNDEPVANLLSLFRMTDHLNRDGFQLLVSAPDGDLKDFAKLFRLLVEGATPNYDPFINKEIYRVLKLF